MRFPGEMDAIDRVRQEGKRFGYGNMIHQLMIEWAAELVSEYGLSAEIAIKAASVDRPTESEVTKRAAQL